MGYRQKKDVLASIKYREHVVKGKKYAGYVAYFGTDPFTRKPLRMMRDSQEELEKEIKSFFLRHQTGGDAAARLTAIQALDAKMAFDALEAAGVNISLADAVKAFLGGSTCNAGRSSDVTVGAAYKEYFKGKLTSADDKCKTRATVGKWSEAYGAEKPLSLVTAKEIADYLDKSYGSKKPKTYNSHLLYLKTFFNWCCKEERKYLLKSPIASVKYREEPWEEPEYMKPEDVERLFRLLEDEKEQHPEMLAQAIISFFCGTRAVEIRRMALLNDAAKIHLDDETIRIAKPKGYQRGRVPRAFHIEPTAMAWIDSFDFLSAVKKITKATIADIYKLARKNKIPVFQNCGRHTFITYHVAAFGDPAKTQAIVGTSAKMRAENYCGLASKANGEAYFKIMPTETADAETVEEIKAAS